MSIKCRKCRNKIIDKSASVFLDAHGQRIDDNVTSNCVVDSLYFIEEQSVPWILTVVEEEGWTKGKLNCPQCAARIGSFDFTSPSRCPCGSTVQPSVHIVKCKVDCELSGVDFLSVSKSVS